MAGQGELNESLCGCFDDIGSCLCGFCCTPCLLGENAQKIDNSSCALYCCAYVSLFTCCLCWLPHCMEREKLRMRFGLRVDSCNDCLTTACCGPCAVSQEARFLNRNAYPMGVMGAMATGIMVPGPMETDRVAPGPMTTGPVAPGSMAAGQMPVTQQPGRYYQT